MAEGKYGNLLAEIRQERIREEPKTTRILVPIKPPAPAGKRSDPAYVQKGAFLKKQTVRIASERLGRRGDKTDFSDLLQALLEAWIATPE